MNDRILLVEDDTKLGGFIAEELILEGYQVTVATNGLDGLTMARNLQPDLLILDWMLPGISGLDLCLRLRSTGIEVPIIMLTAKDEIPDPHNLRLTTRINGELRQNANTGTQIFHIPAQLAWYSHAGFYPGDIVSTGTPAGVAAGHKGEGSWWLKNGDEIVSEIEKIGILRNTVSTRKRRS